jgi:hypothetical protein
MPEQIELGMVHLSAKLSRGYDLDNPTRPGF